MAAVVLFISHSGSDKRIGNELTRVLQDALSLADEEVRYTSEPRFRLRPGTLHSPLLARECTTAAAFVALISGRYLVSPYPMFELGARWGCGKPLLPVRLRGFPGAKLPAPISSSSSTDASDEDELQSLIVELGVTLGRSVTPPNREELTKVTRLNKGWRRFEPQPLKVFAVASALVTTIAGATTYGMEVERDSFRTPARNCRDGLKRLTAADVRLSTTRDELVRAVHGNTVGCDEILSTVAGDDQ